ncbi:hypothetical protein PTKIN_Ptkin13bG0248400 [Pterospermum kingtungense]
MENAEEGLSFFNAMEKTYGVVPREEHYSCVIDVLGRAGQLEEAEDFMDNSVKEKMLQHYSERIAIAFALISMPSGKPIIVKKNLRWTTVDSIISRMAHVLEETSGEVLRSWKFCEQNSCP